MTPREHRRAAHARGAPGLPAPPEAADGVNLQRPFQLVAPTLDGEVLTLLARADRALTGRAIARESGDDITVDDVRPHAIKALETVFGLELEDLPAEDGIGLWAQPVHGELAQRA